jgi:glycerate-2-kinase
MTRDCQEICQAAINAVDPVEAIENRVKHVGGSFFQIRDKEYDLNKYDKLVLVAFGKASSAMASAVLNILRQYKPKDVTIDISGVVIVKDGHATKEETQSLAVHHGIKILEAAHPVPDQRSVDASQELLNLVTSQASKTTLTIACISGGGSALFCAPQSPLTLADLQATNKALLASGWNIQDMNVVRKRLEQGKGGRLAAAAYPGHLVGLILSDVLGDPLDLIASGPTVPDTSTWMDAWKLVEQLPQGTLPDSVMQLLGNGKDGLLDDSPSSDHPVFKQSNNCLVGNNEVAVLAAADKAKQLGYQPVILGTQMVGEASEVAKVLVGLAQHVRQGTQAYSLVQPPAALIAGGETTVTLPKDCEGKGGRNQEMALVAADALKKAGLRQIVFASVGTDGTDGPTDAAGAVVDGQTIDSLHGSATTAIEKHDAYTYLSQTDKMGWSPLIKTGPTGTNVADVSVVLIKSKEQ